MIDIHSYKQIRGVFSVFFIHFQRRPTPILSLKKKCTQKGIFEKMPEVESITKCKYAYPYTVGLVHGYNITFKILLSLYLSKQKKIMFNVCKDYHLGLYV